jgi:argininosuccinate lyase
MWQSDTPIELVALTVTMLVHLDRLAEDLQVWATQEFGLVELADAYSRTSVIMPQKKNPYSLAYVRGLTNVTIGHLAAMANVGRTPTGQPDNRIFAYGQVPEALHLAEQAARLMEGVMGTLSVHVERMAHLASAGYSQATDLADVIMLACDVPYEDAHRVVGQLVAEALERGVPASGLSGEMVDVAAQTVLGRRLGLAPGVLAEALDPRAIVATRTGPGGAAAEPMGAMVAQCREELGQVGSWREDTEARLTASEAGLVELLRGWAANPPMVQAT